ncbi:hypothetical protein QH494_03875 [Sphingomonas sp. AR_OL41]|uniref:hypothetical protein n=1 Tax=Sphingomonas sp. AR_OL41 TaxID=3042729 RepID=UPI002481845E|nr:hypothetical protein [Sphingomonas sp. AR_OL41]MDH7971309.1 hypothetical protein [Sphingomonas sp. AR_OL41]
MQVRKTSAFALYVGSYLPLGLVMLVQDIDVASVGRGVCAPTGLLHRACGLPFLHPSWSLGTVAVAIACLLVTLWTLRAIGSPHQIRVAEAKHVPADLINYAMPYIVSFMGLDFASPTRLLGFGVFFVWIFWITYRSGQIVMNPILIVFGWRLYEIKYSYLQSVEPLVGRALSRQHVGPNKIYRMGSLQDVIIIRELEQGGTNG